MSIPKLSLSGDPQGDAQIVKRARRQVMGWRLRALLLALIAGLFFFRLRMVVPGVIFVLLALAAAQTSRLILKRTVEMQAKLALLEKGR
jgi:Na+-translocating ferredoxin:NAD+ oxidoreductase RnfD subunit